MLPMLVGVFADAAPPQKVLLLVFFGVAVWAVLAIIVRPLRSVRGFGLLTEALSLACPMWGVLCAALNGLHMMQTTLRLPIDVTSRMLAPGLAEMAALIAAGSLAGLMSNVARVGRPTPRSDASLQA